jgi:hypothetical protein
VLSVGSRSRRNTRRYELECGAPHAWNQKSHLSIHSSAIVSDWLCVTFNLSFIAHHAKGCRHMV